MWVRSISSSTTDFEQLIYDVPHNVVWRRLRDGSWIGHDFDALDRLLTSASGGVTLTYDPLGRLYQVASGSATRRFQYAELR